MAFTDPKMGLRIWNHVEDLYNHDQLANNFAKIANHDHTENRGVQIPTEGIADGAITDAKISSGSITSDKFAPGAVSAVVQPVPIGTVVDYIGNTAPANWLILDGSAVSRTTYASLFGLIGTTYGPGNGSTTFNLPNLSGRVTVGVGTATGAAGATAHTLGQSLGEEKHTISLTEIPSHNHGGATGTGSTGGMSANATHNHQVIGNDDGAGGIGGGFDLVNGRVQALFAAGGIRGLATTTGGYGEGLSTDTANLDHAHSIPALSIPSAGGGQPSNNMQPSFVMNKIIRAV